MEQRLSVHPAEQPARKHNALWTGNKPTVVCQYINSKRK